MRNHTISIEKVREANIELASQFNGNGSKSLNFLIDLIYMDHKFQILKNGNTIDAFDRLDLAVHCYNETKI